VEENVTVFSTGLWKYLLAEIIVNMVVCPPGVDL